MTSAPRIGLLTPGWPGHNTPNGIATSVYNLATGLHDMGKTPVILARTIDGPCPSDIPVISLPALTWRWQDRVRSKLGDTGAVQYHVGREVAAAVATAIREYGLDVLVMEETNGWAGVVQAQVPVPVIVTLHGPWTILKSLASLGAAEDARRERREQKGYKSVAGIIAPSRNVLTAIENDTPLPDTPKALIPNSFADDGSGPLAVSLPARNILFVGRFDFLKGADTVLEAFTRLTDIHPDARLTFVGPDRGVQQPDGSVLHMDAALAALPDKVRSNITYRGPLDRAEVVQLRATHAIALTASRYENLNYTLLEAMSAGQAIVSTAVGGPAEVLEDGNTALMVPPADPVAMAAALGRLMEDTTLTQNLGAAARAKLIRDFSPEVVAEQTVTFVENILKARMQQQPAGKG